MTPRERFVALVEGADHGRLLDIHEKCFAWRPVFRPADALRRDLLTAMTHIAIVDSDPFVTELERIGGRRRVTFGKSRRVQETA